MGTTIMSSVSRANTAKGLKFNGIEKSDARRGELGKGFKVYADIAGAGASDAYIIAVKPQDIESALGEIGSAVSESARRTLIISIAAGISTEYILGIMRKYAQDIPVIRVMPNTPALVGMGMTVMAAGEGAADEDIRVARVIFGSMGEVVEMDETLMDVVTAISGSGPAYFFYLAEIMEKFAVSGGIDPGLAKKLVSQTIAGSGEMMKKTSRSFRELREDVTSPGGTTEAAVRYLHDLEFPNTFFNALEKARARSEELLRQKKESGKEEQE